MYINWQIDNKQYLTLVSIFSEQGVLFSDLIKFNPIGSIITALQDLGYEYEQIMSYFEDHKLHLDNIQKTQIKHFISILEKEGILIRLGKDKNRLINSFSGLKLSKFEKPQILAHKKFNGLPNDEWHKYLGKYASHEQFFYPIKVDFDITINCNLKCIFCYHQPFEKKEDLPLDKIKTIINKIKESNVQLVKVIGGEPFLRNDIFDIIEYIKEKGLMIDINTNGTLLDEKTIARLKATGIRSLNISLDADKQKILSQLKNTNYDLVINNIKKAVEAGLRVEVIVTLNKLNMLRLPNIYRILNKIGVEMVSIVAFHAIGIGKENKKKLSISDIVYFLWVRLCKMFLILGKTKYHIMMCDTNSFIHIDHLGYYHFCTQIQRTSPFGNIFDDNLLDVWHSDKYKKLFDTDNLAEPCKSCIFKKIVCNSWRCRAVAYAKTDDFFASNQNCLLGKISNIATGFRVKNNQKM